jgi:pimeloyl-ACP methyl ester carboxylesterase
MLDWSAEAAVHAREAVLEQELKPGNRARITRIEPGSPSRTRYSVVYIHGLSASPGECGDAPWRLARPIGANLYSHRLPGHGLLTDGATQGLTRRILLDDASWALDIGLMLGERVIVLGSSLGATLGLTLAARRPQDVAALVAWSPGIRARAPELLEQLAMLDGVVRYAGPAPTDVQRMYWTEPHADAYRALKDVFEQDMTPETFSKVQCPVFMAYYFRNEQNQDPTASVEAMNWMFDSLATVPARKEAVAYPDGAHVVGSPYRSPAASRVLEDSVGFLQGMLELDADER